MRKPKSPQDAPGQTESTNMTPIAIEPEKPQERPPRHIFDTLGPGVPTFEAYFQTHVDVIRDVQRLLAVSLADDPVGMDRQVREVEALKSVMKSILSFADSYLDVAEELRLAEIGERSKDFTDTDRQVKLAAAVVRERRFRDVVRGLIESIETRISYAQSRLRFIERERA